MLGGEALPVLGAARELHAAIRRGDRRRQRRERLSLDSDCRRVPANGAEDGSGLPVR